MSNRRHCALAAIIVLSWADHAAAAKQAYLDWEFGLVDQLARDGTHGFVVI